MELSHVQIAEYVIKAQAGDSDSFARLYNLTFNKVYNYCRHYLRDDFSAQDAVQDVYISALKNINRIKDPTLFVAWINQIAFRTCYDISKAGKSDYGEPNSELLEEISDASPSSDLEESTINADESKRLKEALEKLPVSYKELVTLRYINDMKIDDIVSATGISRSTVKRHLNEAIVLLRQFMNC